MIEEILNRNCNLTNTKYPSNVYAIRIKDKNENIFDILIKHNGYCPEIKSEREQSRFNDYLSNLENSAIDVYFKINKMKKPKVYSSLVEIVTNSSGQIHHLSKSVNLEFS